MRALANSVFTQYSVQDFLFLEQNGNPSWRAPFGRPYYLRNELLAARTRCRRKISRGSLSRLDFGPRWHDTLWRFERERSNGQASIRPDSCRESISGSSNPARRSHTQEGRVSRPPNCIRCQSGKNLNRTNHKHESKIIQAVEERQTCCEDQRPQANQRCQRGWLEYPHARIVAAPTNVIGVKRSRRQSLQPNCHVADAPRR
jgi:hypothetical protein